MVNTYWKERRRKEAAFLRKTIEDDSDFMQVVNDYYDQALWDIEKEIAAEYAKLQKRGISKEAVSKMDVEKYSKTAKKIVDEAQEKLKAGKRVSFKDYSAEVNQRLKIYNATMRINRLELLKSEIGLYLTQANLNVDSSLRMKLTGDYLKEVRRQAGILGETVPTSLKNNEAIIKALYASYGDSENTTFSDRLWNNQDALKANLDAMVSSGLVRGKSYDFVARQLRDAMNSAKYAAERIVRTESSRVLFKAQYSSFEEYGYDYVRYMAEPKACELCSKYAKADNKLDDLGVYQLDKVPKIPDDTHPNCRCTIVAHWIDDAKPVKRKNKQDQEIEDTVANMQRFFNKDMIDTLGDSTANKLAKILRDAPEPLQKMWTTYKDKMKLDYISEVYRGTSHYSPSSRTVTIFQRSMNLQNDPKYYEKQFDVFFHEFGHMIDYQAAERLGIKSKYKYSLPNMSDSLEDAIDKDWNNLVEPRFKEFMDHLEYTETKGNKAKVKVAKSQTPVWIRIKKDGSPYATELKRLRHQFGEEAMVKQIREDTANLSRQDKGDISDILSGLGFDYPLGVGHSQKYWNNYKKWKGEIRSPRNSEAFAEMTSAAINNPEAVKLFKKYFPETWKKFNKIVKETSK